MNQLLIAKNIFHHRQLAEITQEQLANILGVTKAAVSKWETGQSLPDILLLPRLATYFNVTIDELMGYSRQLTTTQIQKIYKTLSENFATLQIDVAIEKCRSYVKDYYHCYPLLVKICGLYINHLDLMTIPEQRQSVINDIISLCEHINKYSDNLSIVKESKSLLTITYLMSGQPELALQQIGADDQALVPDTALRAQCYSLLGEKNKAEKSLQVGIYQHLITLLQLLIDYMPLQFQDEQKFLSIYTRIKKLMDTFNLPEVHPNSTVRAHYVAAIGYIQFGNIELALSCLKQYVYEIKQFLFPIQLKGDAFFTHIIDWFAEMDISLDAPRDPLVVKQSLIQSLQYPAFTVLQERAEFKQLVYDLNQITIN